MDIDHVKQVLKSCWDTIRSAKK